MKKHLLSFFALLLLISSTYAQTITTVAGNGNPSYNGDGIQATSAGMDPIGVAVDNFGNVYFSDYSNHRIRKISATGVITTIAGNDTAGYSGDGGPATDAKIDHPANISIDPLGNLFFCDANNNRVRIINIAGIISTIAGNGTGGFSGDNGPATDAKLLQPFGIALDQIGNVYITDCANKRVRKINSSGIITTIAGTGIAGYSGDNGPATDAKLNYPRGVTIDGVGNIYIADGVNHRVRKIDATGIITTFAGTGIAGYDGDTGPSTNAKIDGPYGILLDNDGNLLVSDAGYNSTIRRINQSGIITTIAGIGNFGFCGDNGPATNACLNFPAGIALDGNHGLFICDANNSRIRYTQSYLGTNLVHSNPYTVCLYPNPVVSGAFTLNISSNSEEKITIIISNMVGEKVKEVFAGTNRPVEITLDVPQGIYLVTIITSEGILNKRICVNQ